MAKFIPWKVVNLSRLYWWEKSKGRIFSEKYWYYFHCPKNVLCSILSFVFWIFPPLDTAVQLESADSKQNAISKSLFQDSFRHIFWAMRKMHHTFWKKATFNDSCIYRRYKKSSDLKKFYSFFHWKFDCKHQFFMY